MGQRSYIYIYVAHKLFADLCNTLLRFMSAYCRYKSITIKLIEVDVILRFSQW
jgi:hypothetical protein